jgi:hypothetical protein
MEMGLDFHLQPLAFQLKALGLVLPAGNPALIGTCLAIGSLQGLTHLPVVAPKVCELDKLVD